MGLYQPGARAQRFEIDWEVGRLLSQGADCREVGQAVVGKQQSERWSRAIRSIPLRDADRLHVDGPDRHPVPAHRAVAFSEVPIYPENTRHERRFFALLLIVLGEVRPWGRSGRRACTRRLFRGHQHREIVTAEGDFGRQFVRKGHQGGLAARLGCSVRDVDLYLRIARAARLIDVWQMPKKNARAGQAGRKYGYAVFSWLCELPTATRRRLEGNRRPDASPAHPSTPPSPLTETAPTAGVAPLEGSDDTAFSRALRALKGRPEPPS